MANPTPTLEVFGDLRLSGGTYNGIIVCDGNLSIVGDVTAAGLAAAHIDIGPHRVNCDSIKATKSLTVHPEADVPSLFAAWRPIALALEAAYAKEDFPAAVAQLIQMMTHRRVDHLRSQLPQIWHGLLTYHHGRGAPPTLAVCGAIRDLNNTLESMT